MTGRTVSTWSLHRTLGRAMWRDATATDAVAGPPEPGGVPLLELPKRLREHGYDRVQICHFHLPTRAPAYLGEVRAALAESAVELDAVLVDDGDLTHASDADAHETWIHGWLDDAEVLGARRARVIAGRSAPSVATVTESARRLRVLADAHPGVRVVTENWHELMPDAASVLAVLDQAGDGVGFLIDLGNWTGAGKYAELAAVADRAETCHAKCGFADGRPDAEDFQRSLQVLADAAYAGPLALVYDGADDAEWECLDAEQRIVERVFA